MEYIYFTGQLLLALVLGGVLGWQREHIGKKAGTRTYTLVTIGATLFTLIAYSAFGEGAPRIAAQIITGIGFLGAGMILHRDGGVVEGLTTAAGLWAAAAVGMAIGVGWHWQAVIATAFIFLILFVHKGKN